MQACCVTCSGSLEIVNSNERFQPAASLLLQTCNGNLAAMAVELTTCQTTGLQKEEPSKEFKRCILCRTQKTKTAKGQDDT